MSMVSTITALIANRALCRNCIAARTSLTPEAVDAEIKALARGVQIDRYPNGTCAECGEEGLVFAIDRASRR